MPEPVDERDASIETRGPADFRVQLWTNPPVAEQGTCAAYDFEATHAAEVIAWAQTQAARLSPCLAEVLLKRRLPDGELETIEIASFLHGAPFRAPDGQGANGDFSLLAGAGFMPAALWFGAGTHHDEFGNAGAADAIVGTPDATPFGLDGGSGFDAGLGGGFDGGGFGDG